MSSKRLTQVLSADEKRSFFVRAIPVQAHQDRMRQFRLLSACSVKNRQSDSETPSRRATSAVASMNFVALRRRATDSRAEFIMTLVKSYLVNSSRAARRAARPEMRNGAVPLIPVRSLKHASKATN
jgi:hypothetical protein